MFEEHGTNVFENGCVVCREICCCGINRSEECTRKFHCYKKCPAMKKVQKKRQKSKTEKVEPAKSLGPSSGQSGKSTQKNDSEKVATSASSQSKPSPSDSNLEGKKE